MIQKTNRLTVSARDNPYTNRSWNDLSSLQGFLRAAVVFSTNSIAS